MAGKKLGDRMIEKYITDEGKYPENIGMVLWSGPNMRSSGQDIAEFLYLLGVKPVWQKGSLRVTDLEVIPLDELKRPRIDVTARISGLFRDTLPHLAELMDKAVLMVAKLDESDDDNFVRKHIHPMTITLCASISVKTAKPYRQTALPQTTPGVTRPSVSSAMPPAHTVPAST